MTRKSLILLLVAVLLSGTLIGCIGRGALADEPMPIVPLSEEMEQRIKEDFIIYLPTVWPDMIGNMGEAPITIDDIVISRYINTYENGVVLFITVPSHIAYPDNVPIYMVGSYKFVFNSGQPMYFYVINSGEFMHFEVAFDIGLLSIEEVRDLHRYFR